MNDAKIAVYTVILPHTYVELSPPCFINRDENQAHYWVITDEPLGIDPWCDLVVTRDPKLSSRRDLHQYKLLSHRWLPEYDFVLYVDGWARLVQDPVDIVNELKESGKKVAFGAHPWRDCSYEEGHVCARFQSNSEEIINAQLARYEEEGFPHNFGLAASTFFVRDNRDAKVSAFFDLWYDETTRGSHRNQISWGRSVWKSKIEPLIWDIPWGINRFYTSNKEA